MKRGSRLLWTGAVLATPLGAAGQSAWVGPFLTTYTIDQAPATAAEQIQLFAAPVEAWWGLGAFSVGLEAAFADAIVTFSGGGFAERSGISDTRIYATYRLGNATVSGFAALPTGDSRYSTGELPLLAALNSDLLPLSAAWGSGGGAGMDITLNARVESAAVMVGAGYVVQGEFEPLVGVGAVYRPGNQLRVSAGFEAPLGPGTAVGLLVGYQRFSEDRFDAENLFRAGGRWEAEATVIRAVGARESVSLFVGAYGRSSGLVVTGSDGFPVLSGVSRSPERRLLRAGLEAQATRGRLTVLPELEVRSLSTGDDVGAGRLGSVGARTEYRLLGGQRGRQLVLSPAARYLVGSVDLIAGTSSPVRGWEVGVSARWISN